MTSCATTGSSSASATSWAASEKSRLDRALFLALLEHIAEADDQGGAGRGEGVFAKIEWCEGDLRRHDRIGGDHLSSDPAEKRRAAPDDDRITIHELHDQRRAHHDQRNGQHQS